jgi:hypothetical protein
MINFENEILQAFDAHGDDPRMLMGYLKKLLKKVASEAYNEGYTDGYNDGCASENEDYYDA